MRIQIIKIILLFFIPSICFADGMSVETYTLQSLPYAFVVNVLVLDLKKHIAKIQLIKAFQNEQIPSKSPMPLQMIPAKSWNENQSNFPSDRETPFAQIRASEDYFVPLRTPPEGEPGAWVIEQKYWDAEYISKDFVTKKLILVGGPSGFEFVKWSAEKEKKIELLFKPRTNFEAIRQKLSVDDLKSWIADEDLRQEAIVELQARKSLTAEFIFSLKTSDIIKQLIYGIGNKSTDEERKEFFRQMISSWPPLKVEDDKLAEFLSIYFNYSRDAVAFSDEVKMISQLNLKNTIIRKSLNVFMYKIERRINEKNNEHFVDLIDYVLSCHRYDSNVLISIDSFYKSLDQKAQQIMMEKMAEHIVSMGSKDPKVSTFGNIFRYLIESPNLSVALKLSNFDYFENSYFDKSQVLESIFKTRIELEDMNDKNKRIQFIKFVDQFIQKPRYGYLSENLRNKLEALRAR